MRCINKTITACVAVALLMILIACADLGSSVSPIGENVTTTPDTHTDVTTTDDPGGPPCPEPAENILLYAGDDLVFDLTGNVSASLPAGSTSVRVENSVNGASVCALFYDVGGCLYEAVKSSENVYSTVIGDNEDATVSPVVKIGDRTVMYASSLSAFMKVAGDDEYAGCEVIMTSDMNADEIVISTPFTWITNSHKFSTEELIFRSSGSGSMVIKNDGEDSISCSDLICKTPGWDIDAEHPFSYLKEEEHLFIDAKSLCGRPVDLSSLTFTNAGQLAFFTDDNGIITFDESIKSIVFSGDYELPSLSVNKPAALIFKGSIRLPETLGISVMSEGEITVDTTSNSIELFGRICIFAPNAGLVWKGPDAPGIQYAEQYMNISAYNGIVLDRNIGGMNPDILTECKLDSLRGDIDGFYVTFEMPYNIPRFSETSSLNATCVGDSDVSLTSEDGNFYITLTNGDNKVGYRVVCTDRSYYLPKFFITTEGGQSITSKEEYIGCGITVDYNGYPGADDYAQVLDASGLIRGRGNSSWKLDKKPYKIKFDSKTSLFGLTAAKKWVLQANHADKSLMRNTLAMAIGQNLTNMCFIPHSYLIDVFINGEYVGVYSLTEQVEIKEGRLEGTENSTDEDTDYLLEIGGEKTETYFGSNVFSGTLTRYVEIHNPDAEVLTKEQYIYIRQYVRDADAAVANLSNYEDYIDVDSLIDWFILHELSYNLDDSFRRSVFLIKKQGGKLYLAAPWDFDYAFGNFNLDSDKWDEWICLGNKKTDDYDMYIKENWMDHLLTDKNFTDKLKARWNEVKESLYNSAMEAIDHTEQYASSSAETNYEVWQGCMGVKIQFEKKSTAKIDTYAGNLEFLRTFIKNRYNWMDKQINKYLPVAN